MAEDKIKNAQINANAGINANKIASGVVTNVQFQRLGATVSNGGNAAYNILATDKLAYAGTAFTLPRTWTLPSASSLSAGDMIIVADFLQTITSTNTLTVAVQAGQYLNGILNGTEVISSAGGWRSLVSDGTSNWSFDAGVVRLASTQTLTNKTLTNGLANTQSAGDNSLKIATTAYVDAGDAAIKSQISAYPSTTVAAATTTYFFIGGTAIGSTTESNRYTYMSKAGTISDLYVYTVTSQSVTGSMVITIRVALADTAVTLTIAAGSAGGVFSDNTHSVAYAKGNIVTIKAQNNAAAVVSAQINSMSMAI